MDRVRDWLKLPYGKKLKRLHAWNAWVVLLLAITGIILSIPVFRETGVLRVWTKQAHIALGVLSVIVITLYLPVIAKHWKQLQDRSSQKWNLFIVLFILVGWSLSGIVLWQFRALPAAWANYALWIHDAFTWVGIPYALYHSISRSRWVKSQGGQTRGRHTQAPRGVGTRSSSEQGSERVASSSAEGSADRGDNQAERTAVISLPAAFNRRSLIRVAIGSILVVLIGPSFYRWLKRTFDSGGGTLIQYTAGDEYRMLPEPIALPESSLPAGGGLQGNFRIYTVTEIPVFTSDKWQFILTGLVDKPLSWSWEQLLSLKRKVQVSDFHCVTGWSVYKVTWEGIPLSQLLDMAGVKEKAKFVKFYSGDGVYTDGLSLEQARMEDVMVAILMDGIPIPQKLGGPVRLIVPEMYAYKSVKWLQAIELIEKEHFGYWEVRGYDNDAWVARNRLKS